MKLQIEDLVNLKHIDTVIIHSIDWMIYQVSIEVNGDERLVYEGEQPFRCRNLLEVRALCEPLNIGKIFLLRPNSTYDEMIGQPAPMFNDSLKVEMHWSKASELSDLPRTKSLH